MTDQNSTDNTVTAIQGNGKPWAMITGASAGIGQSFAMHLAELGYNPVLVARRADRLKSLAAEIEQQFEVDTYVVVADLSESSAVTELHANVKAQNIEVSFLVNNAGYGIKQSFLDAPWSAHADMLQLMAVGLTQMCYVFGQDMKAQGAGYIINVGSISGFMPQVAGVLYGPIKSYVNQMSDALHMEFSASGVNVSALCPGLTRTEFHEKMDIEKSVRLLPDFVWMSSDDVVTQAIVAVTEGKSVHISGGLNTAVSGIARSLPQRLRHTLGRMQKMT